MWKAKLNMCKLRSTHMSAPHGIANGGVLPVMTRREALCGAIMELEADAEAVFAGWLTALFNANMSFPARVPHHNQAAWRRVCAGLARELPPKAEKAGQDDDD